MPKLPVRNTAKKKGYCDGNQSSMRTVAAYLNSVPKIALPEDLIRGPLVLNGNCENQECRGAQASTLDVNTENK